MIEEKKKPLDAETEAPVQTELKETPQPILETEPVVEVSEPRVESMSEIVPEQSTPVEPIIAPKPLPVRVAPSPQKDKLEQEIEEVLSEDLKELYVAMPQSKQKEFKAKGEETVSKIRQLVHATKFNAKKIFHLIREWLKLIPGVNRFFLEQEAKIKTDKVLIVVEEEKRRGAKELM